MLGRLGHGLHPWLGLAGRDFARLARPTILAHLAPQRDDVDVARRGRVEVDERAAHEVGARARDVFAVRLLDHRRRGIDRRGDQPNGNALQQTLRDEAVAQAIGRRVLRQTRRGGGSRERELVLGSRPRGAVVVAQQRLVVGPADGFSLQPLRQTRQGSARARARCASCLRPSSSLALRGAGRRDDRLRDRRP